MKATTHRFLGGLGLALTAAALLVGGAQAAERPDDRGGMIGVGAAQFGPTTPDAFERAVLRSAAANPVPDAFERAVLRESRGVAAVRPDDRAVARGPGIVPTALPTVAASADEGLRWNDAFLGAVAMLGVVLFGAAATLTIRRGGVVLR